MSDYFYQEFLTSGNEKADLIFCKNFTSWCQDLMEKKENNCLEEIKNKLKDFTFLLNCSQSPIEQILGAGLIFSTNGYMQHNFDYFTDDEHSIEKKLEPESFGTILGCQGNIGKYKADFIITCYCKNLHKRIAIECDGHNFHEKTKEQAQMDKARDRFFAKNGIITLRFTGSEIYRNTAACVEEIENIVFDELSNLMINAGFLSRRENKHGI